MARNRYLATTEYRARAAIPWTDEHDTRLKRDYSRYERDSALEVLAVLMRRTVPALKARARSLGLFEGAATDEKQRFQAGWRDIGQQRIYFRSKWEANYARYLEWLRANGNIDTWEYEPHTFWFEGIRRGVVSYKPDFRVTEAGDRIFWHEVKGYMDHRSTLTLKRMAKYHPGERIVLVDGPRYYAIRRQCSGFIEGWE